MSALLLPALRTALAAAATELLLLRATAGEPPALADLAGVLVVALALAALVPLAARLHPRLAAIAGGLPLALGGIGLSVPVVLGFPGSGPLLVALVALALALGLRGAARATPVAPGARQTVAGLLGMAALTWVVTGLSQGGQPAADQALGAALVAAATLALGGWAGLLLPLSLLPGPAPAAWTASGPVPDGPDIVLITVDTLRADSAATMASWQRLAAEGAALQGQASSPWTLPSMASLMTGLEPHRHGAGRGGDGGFHGLPAEVPTLAGVLAAAGWDTAATVENPFVGAAFGLTRDFAVVHEVALRPYALPVAPLADRPRPWQATALSALGLIPPLPAGALLHVAHARELLASRRDRPLLLWVHLFDPHLPYRHAVELDLPLSRRLDLATFVRQDEDQPPPEDLAGLRLAYDHEVARTDAAIGQLLDLLGPPPERGRITVLTSDHGEEFGEHGGWEHGHSMYQELLAVPLVVAGIDGLRPGLAGLVDVVPTVLGAAGLPLSPTDGRDLRRGPTAVVRSSAPLYADPQLRAVRAGARKAIAAPDGLWAYDLDADPGELHPGEVDPVLQAMLPPPFAPREGAGEVDAETRARLEAIGYVEAAP